MNTINTNPYAGRMFDAITTAVAHCDGYISLDHLTDMEVWYDRITGCWLADLITDDTIVTVKAATIDALAQELAAIMYPV